MRAVVAIDPGDECGVALVIDQKPVCWQAVDFKQNRLDLVVRTSVLHTMLDRANKAGFPLDQKILLVCEQPYLPMGIPGAVMATAKVYANATLWEAAAFQGFGLSTRFELAPRVNAASWQSKLGIKGNREERFDLADKRCETLFSLNFARNVAQAVLLGYAVANGLVAGKEVGDHKKQKAKRKSQTSLPLEKKPRRTKKCVATDSESNSSTSRPKTRRKTATTET